MFRLPLVDMLCLHFGLDFTVLERDILAFIGT